MSEEFVLQRVVRRGRVSASAQAQEDLEYWLSRPPEERIAAVEYLRRQYYGTGARLQRVARVVKRRSADGDAAEVGNPR